MRDIVLRRAARSSHECLGAARARRGTRASRTRACGRSPGPSRPGHAARPRSRARSSASASMHRMHDAAARIGRMGEHGDAERTLHAGALRDASESPRAGRAASRGERARARLRRSATSLPLRTSPMTPAWMSRPRKSVEQSRRSEVCGTDRRKPKLGKVFSQRSSATPGGGSIASRSMSIATPEHSASIVAVPGMPPWLMSLAARARPRSAIFRQQREIGAQALRGAESAACQLSNGSR